MENYKILPEQAINKFNIRVVYALVECKKCGKRFGINPIDNYCKPNQLLCQPCALKHLEELEEQE